MNTDGIDTDNAIKISGGSPTPAEVAALTTVIVALRRQPPAPHPPVISQPRGWRSHWDTIRAAQLPIRRVSR